MANVKTAISLGKPLLEQVDMTAQEMGIPRSRLFVLAVEEFLRRRENERLMEAINQAYSDLPNLDEKTEQAAMQRVQRQMVEGTW